MKKINTNRTLIEQFKQLEVDLQLSYVQTLTRLKDFRQFELDKLENEKHKIDDENSSKMISRVVIPTA